MIRVWRAKVTEPIRMSMKMSANEVVALTKVSASPEREKPLGAQQQEECRLRNRPASCADAGPSSAVGDSVVGHSAIRRPLIGRFDDHLKREFHAGRGQVQPAASTCGRRRAVRIKSLTGLR